MNTLRGLVAVVGGLAVTRLIVQPLEITLVNALAPQPPQTAADVVAVLNAPIMMAARVVYTGVGAILGGYLTARIAGHDPMRYTMIAALFLALILIVGFASGYEPATPVWIRVALVFVSTGGMLAGGAVRSAVAALPQTPRTEEN